METGKERLARLEQRAEWITPTFDPEPDDVQHDVQELREIVADTLVLVRDLVYGKQA